MKRFVALTDPEGLRPSKPVRILVAGIGNMFLGDDGFGVAVVEQLARHALPNGVVLMDAGIRGLDLTYALLGDYEAGILIDAAQRGSAPGSLYVIDPEAPQLAVSEDETNPAGLLDAHAMDPMKVLAFVRQSGSTLRAMRVVGCEPLTFGSDEEPVLGLSAPVKAAIPIAIEQVLALITQLQNDLSEAVVKRELPHA